LLRAGNEIIAFGYNEEKEINDLLERSEKSIFEVTQVFIKNKLVHIKDILELRYQEFAEIHENPELMKDHRLQL
jgi:replicative DNA helicase